MRDRQRIRGRAGRHQEDRHLALEDFRKTRLDPPGPRVVAVTERIPGVGLPDRREDVRRNSGGVVTCDVHRVSLICRGPENAILLRCGINPWSSCYVRERGGATNVKESVDSAVSALANRARFRHIRTALLSQLRVRREGCGVRETASGPARDRRAAKAAPYETCF